MGDISIFPEFRNGSHFKIHYPYYGLFGTADITPLSKEDEVIYRCRLLNGTILHLKKLIQQKKWIDLTMNSETPLAAVIGNSIDEFFKRNFQ